MSAAVAEAHEAALAGEVPVGAVLLQRGEIVARANNRMRRDGDATSHAELLVLRDGMQQLGEARLRECTLVVTLEPCAMCAGAIVLARVARVVFGAWDDKAGMCGSVGDVVRHPKLNHHPEVVGGVQAETSAQMLRAFFEAKRQS
ncbi:MAG: nucleoside deaminase [Gemmatimonadaceae bacterium]|nr:nucleoside deaminase [Gemmatimonadaceae bacterium]